MLGIRVIPVLLYNGTGLVKSIKFSQYTYIGDAINAIKIFNDKEVDELLLLDISATPHNRKPDYRLISDVASECFMPLGYGGGINDVEDIRRIFKLGVEKISLNTAAVIRSDLIQRAADAFGSQSIVASIDVRRNRLGRYEVFTHGGKKGSGLEVVEFARRMEESGAGEILLNSIDRDGMMQGYDLEFNSTGYTLGVYSSSGLWRSWQTPGLGRCCAARRSFGGSGWQLVCFSWQASRSID